LNTTSQSSHTHNGDDTIPRRKINLHPPVLNVNNSSCRECLVVAYLIKMSKPSDYTASNYQMILNSDPKATLTEVSLSKLKAVGSLKGYNSHFT